MGDRIDRPRQRALKKRGIALATAGFGLALAVELLLDAVGLTDLDLAAWVGAVALTLALQALLWLIPHRGWDARLTWDPHYVYLPLAVAAVLLNLYGYLVPEARVLLLMAWFVALLFLAGVGGLREVVGMSSLMAGVHLLVGAILSREGRLFTPFGYDAMVTAVFFAVCAYAGFVFRRLRGQRREMARLREELAALAMRDALTGLPNRRLFEERLREEVARVRRYQGICSVAMVDVDHFKTYNDTLGHPAGDQVLQELARILQANVRETDVAARYGGEEFGLILVRTPIERAWEVLERLRREVQRHGFPREEVMPTGDLTVSAGIASATGSRADAADLVERADRALYAAKEAGRNRVHLAT